MTRLTDERLAELFTGTLHLVAEHGFDKVTMDRIAEATHSSKATLYRQWGSKASLVADALLRNVEDHHVEIDTGTLRGDLVLMLTHDQPDAIADAMLIGALMQAIRTDPELDQALRERVISVGRERIDDTLRLAVERGEIAPDCPGLAHAALLVITIFVLQPVVDGVTWSDAEKLHYIDAVLLPVLGIH